MSADVDALIVGGGIGGLANALALSRAGLRVRVLEQATEFAEVGAGLQIAPNCTRILSEWGLFDEIASLGVLPKNIVMKDAVDGRELTRLDLSDVAVRYGAPYVVIHRSDLHATLLRACRRSGVDLVNNIEVAGYEQTDAGAAVRYAGGGQGAPVVIAADGLHSRARSLISDDAPVSSSYVAFRGTVLVDELDRRDVSMTDVVAFVGPRCHFIQYGLRQGDVLNQVAVFQSPKALAGATEWGTPDELDAAFAGTCDEVRAGLPHMWRDRRWLMFDRDPIMNWVQGRIVLTGDSAHPPLQYLAQGAVMAIEDAWVLGKHVAAQFDRGPVDWDEALRAYNAVRPEHCRRVVTVARSWGQFMHHAGPKREWRNQVLRDRDVYDYGFVDWLYGPTALTPGAEPQMLAEFGGVGASPPRLGGVGMLR